MSRGADHLESLRARRSVRTFADEPIAREVLERVLSAAITAPSATNRQPWRFVVVTDAAVRAELVAAVRRRTGELKEALRASHHAAELEGYDDFFHEPLASAAAIVLPMYREHPDLIAGLLSSSGADPARYVTPASMQVELCATSAAVMCLLLQAHAEGLGACWMAGPMVARDELQARLGVRAPWRTVGAIALGHPAEEPAARPRKPVEKVVTWFPSEGE